MLSIEVIHFTCNGKRLRFQSRKEAVIWINGLEKESDIEQKTSLVFCRFSIARSIAMIDPNAPDIPINTLTLYEKDGPFDLATVIKILSFKKGLTESEFDLHLNHCTSSKRMS